MHCSNTNEFRSFFVYRRQERKGPKKSKTILLGGLARNLTDRKSTRRRQTASFWVNDAVSRLAQLARNFTDPNSNRLPPQARSGWGPHRQVSAWNDPAKCRWDADQKLDQSKNATKPPHVKFLVERSRHSRGDSAGGGTSQKLHRARRSVLGTRLHSSATRT